jgi:hypothetical protein
MLGIDNIYGYGIKCLVKYHEDFYAAGCQNHKPYSTEYIPNPFRYQYDLTMFIWLNYYKLLQMEVEHLMALHAKNPKAGHDNEANELLATRELYGITRTDFMFAAGELRWPTTISETGEHRGLFIRDPWAERRVAAISHETKKYVMLFGGGGQGKTLVCLAVSLMIFDYFIFTQKGARCMLSTVNKDKLDSVGWAYLCNLNSSTQAGISLYAGRARIAGDHTLARPGNKDKGGVFKGILIGNQMNNQSIIDKLTGSHGHPFVMYILDELQSTPNPPIIAAPNYTMHAKDYRIVGAGNYGENNDTLANNIKPDIGWDAVDETTGEWVSTTENGAKAIVLHFNNNLSPGMSDEGHARFPHMPSQKTLDKNYPDKKNRTSANISYKRFWVGFRVPDSGENNVIFEALVKENLADSPLVLDSVTHTMFAFDSAQAELDRNLCVIGKEGICSITKQRVFGPHSVIPLVKSTESIKYYTESSNQLLDIARKHNIMSGNAVVDWTGRPAQAEMLQSKGFGVKKLIYNVGVPDGTRRDKHTGKVERAIRLNVHLDFNNDIPAEKVCAHHVAENMISLGAWALQQYIKAGRVRGINESLVKFMNGERSLEEELYFRRYKMKNSATYGSRFHLESKIDFKKQYGFSPDLLDCLFEMAWYMLMFRRLPLTPVGGNDIVEVEKGMSDDFEDHSSLWELDLV